MEDGQSFNDDSFFETEDEEDKESLIALRDAISVLKTPATINSKEIEILDREDSNFEDSFDFDSLLESEANDKLVESLKAAEKEICNIKSTLFKTEQTQKTLEQPEQYDYQQEYQTPEAKFNVILPILLLQADQSTSQFFNALRVIPYVGSPQIEQLLQKEFEDCMQRREYEHYEAIVANLLNQNELDYVLSKYNSNVQDDVKIRLIAAISGYFSTQGYFESVKVVLSRGTGKYELRNNNLIISEEQYRIFELQNRRVSAPCAEPLEFRRFEAFLFGQIQATQNAQLFCTLLDSLRVYMQRFELFSVEKAVKFVKMLIAQFQRISSTLQQTALIITILSSFEHYQFDSAIVELFMERLLASSLDAKSARAIQLCLSKIKVLPPISEQLEEGLIRANYCDFFPYFDMTREFLLEQIEKGNTKYFRLISEVAHESPSAGIRLFSNFMVLLQGERVFTNRLRLIKESMQLLQYVENTKFSQIFTKEKILAYAAPGSEAECKKLFQQIDVEDLSFVSQCTVYSAAIICKYCERYTELDGKSTFLSAFSKSKFCKEFE